MTFFAKMWNLSPDFGFVFVFLYANSVFAVFCRDASTANNEVRLYIKTYFFNWNKFWCCCLRD